MSTVSNDTLTPTATDGPGFVGGLLWATFAVLICTFAVGAAFQGASGSAGAAAGDVVATQ